MKVSAVFQQALDFFSLFVAASLPVGRPVTE